MTRILLTGATGFVGRPLVRHLLQGGHELRCAIRTGSRSRLPRKKDVEVVETNDLFAESAEWWAAACERIETIIHIAWYAEPGRYLTSDKNLDCMVGTLALARGAAQAGVRRFVGTGTCFEYDLSYGLLTPSTPLEPDSPYAAAKASTWQILASWLPEIGISFLWARLFYLYGEGEDPRRLVPYLHRQLSSGQPADLTSGEAVRDYIEVGRAAELLASEALGTREGAVNICSGQGTSIRELAESIADRYGRRDLLNFGGRTAASHEPAMVVGTTPEEEP